jgi:HEAT repeat protein
MCGIIGFLYGAILCLALGDLSQSDSDLFHKDSAMRLKAIADAGKLREQGKKLLPSLIKAYSTESSPQNRNAILMALCEIDSNDPHVYKTILNALRTPPGESSSAVFLLWHNFGTRPIADLTKILNDKKTSPHIRCAAISALDGILNNHVNGEIPKYVMDSFEINLFDGELAVRLDIACIVQECAKRRPEQAPIATLIRSFTTEKSDAMRINVGSALSNCGRKVIPFLRKTLRHDDEHIRLHTLYVVGSLGSDALPLINDIQVVLGDRSEQVRKVAKEIFSDLKKLQESKTGPGMASGHFF